MSQYTPSLRAKELAKKKRIRRVVKYSLIVFCALAFIGLLSYISYRKNIRISHVELSGGILVTQNDVESETLSFLHGSYIGLFPRNNIFLYPQAALEADLRAHFPRIDQISIDRNGFHTVRVTIRERQADALWCDIDTHCYFMDNTSRVFAEAPQFSGDAYFKYFGMLASSSSATLTSPIGREYMASTTEFQAIRTFVENVRAMSLKPLYLTVREDGQATLVLSGGANIYIDTRTSLTEASDNLEALIHTPAFSHATSEETPIDYIDLRYGNKLFYTLKSASQK